MVNPECQPLFEEWKATHERVYETLEEDLMRRSIFCSNLIKIIKHNLEGHGWTMSMNHFGDLTPNEFSAHMTGSHCLILSSNHPYFDENYQDVDFLEEVNWVKEGRVTPVKNQGHCGSCWSFSATGAIESAFSIAGHPLISLSEQQLIDCSASFGNHGCDGGMMDRAFSYVVKTGGLCSEEEYPYQGVNGQCQVKTCGRLYDPIISFHYVAARSQGALMEALMKNPVSVGIEADQASFQFYSSGVMTSSCGNKIDHGVLAVGYGWDGDQSYWLIKNSWGSAWGEDGYIRLGMNSTRNGGTGQCGILSQPSFPVVP
jgi:C1A family cysteine protease